MKRDSKIKLVAYCVLAIALTASGVARAETIYLTCGPNYTFTVDLTNHTVNNTPADFTATHIIWGAKIPPNSAGTSAYMYNDINRVAGTYTSSATYYFANGTAQPSSGDTVSCTVGSAPATKF